MKTMQYGAVPERGPNYPGGQPTTAQMQAARAWAAFMNGGFRNESVPFGVLKEMTENIRRFEENFRKLDNLRKLEFMKFFWASANGRGKNENMSQRMADAVAVMRENEPFRKFPGPKSEPLMVC